MLFNFIKFFAKWILLPLVILAVAVAAFVLFHPVFGGKPDAASMERIQKSPQFNGKEFVNLEPTELMTTEEEISPISWAWQKLTDKPAGKNPSEPLPTVALDTAALKDGSAVWFGHSSVLFQTGGQRLMTDPVFHRASPVPLTGGAFAMSHTPTVAELPELNAVLISHDHYDHLDYIAIGEIAPKTQRFIVPLGVKAHLLRWGVAADKITELDWYETVKVGDVDITLVPSRHFSGRGLTNRNSTLWGGYVVKSPDLSMYFTGDSGYGSHYKQIAERYAPFDFVLVENGAYNDKWAKIHEFPEQSVQAVLDVNAKRAMPIHWAKFDLSEHNWKEPVERFLQAAATANLEVATPKIGQVFQMKENLPSEKWWETVKE